MLHLPLKRTKSDKQAGSMEEVIRYIFDCNNLSEELKFDHEDIKAAKMHLREMFANINPALIRSVTLPLGKILNKLYDGLSISCAGGMDLNHIVNTNNVVFVPNHQSHADYILFNYVLFKEFGIAPYTAGGINLNIFPVGYLLRNMGCVFIRRSFQDNRIYKQTLKSYIHYLMIKKNHPLEFYYEGGRSRNGMLQAPKFGFFNMIIDNHMRSEAGTLPSNNRPLVFIPVSIVHEFLPEQSSLARETGGHKKNPESAGQLLGALRVLNKKFGKTHIHIGNPVGIKDGPQNFRTRVQNIAFSCYREVANGIPVTPVAMMALILLDSPAGGITRATITTRARELTDYCTRFHIPLANRLRPETLDSCIEDATAFLSEKGIIRQELQKGLNKMYYVVKEQQRVALSYFKNTILHHFFLPALIFLVWERIRTEEIRTAKDIQRYILDKRKELKYDIYIPSTETMWTLGPQLMKYFSDGKAGLIDSVFKLSGSDFQTLGERTSFYGNFFRYKYEAYYVAALTLLNLADKPFVKDQFFRYSLEVFRIEKQNGTVIRQPESYSRPVMKNTLNYCLNQKIIAEEGSQYRVADPEKIKSMIIRYSQNILDIYQMNLKNAVRTDLIR